MAATKGTLAVAGAFAIWFGRETGVIDGAEKGRSMGTTDSLMPSSALVLHHVPGRIRIGLTSAKGNTERSEAIKTVLGSLTGVQYLKANPVLGTFVIHYDPKQFANFPVLLSEAARQYGWVNVQGAFRSNLETQSSLAGRSLDQGLGDLNKAVQSVTRNAINLKELVPLGILVYAVTFVDKAIQASQWLGWVQFAFSTYMDLHDSEPVVEVAKSLEALRAQIMLQERHSMDRLNHQFDTLRAEIRVLAQQNAAR